jgi:hypothetical protein
MGQDIGFILEGRVKNWSFYWQEAKNEISKKQSRKHKGFGLTLRKIYNGNGSL